MALRMAVPLSTCPHTLAAPSLVTKLCTIVAASNRRGCHLRRPHYPQSLRPRDNGGPWMRPFSVMASSSRPASQTMPNEKLDEETRWWEEIRAHQKEAARLSKVDESRTLVATSSTATLSTISQKYDGFPLGSMVLYATDDSGRPILAISSLSPHTKDLESNSKCSLLVARDASDISDIVVTIIGKAETISDAESDSVRSVYLRKHPDAFWVDFGDFRFVRITPEKIRFLAGSATAFVTFGGGDKNLELAALQCRNELDGEEYLAGAVDPVAHFTAPIAGHMNRDHADQTKAIAETSLGVKIAYAKMLQVDRLGFNIEAGHDGKPVKLRIPFPRPAQDRKDIKTLIVEMLQGATS